MSSSNFDSLHTTTFTWKIDKFTTLEVGENTVKSIFYYPAQSIDIRFNLFIKPKNKTGSKDTISLYLGLLPWNVVLPTIYATFNAHVLSNDGLKIISKSTQVHEHFNENEISPTCCGWKDFLNKDQYFRRNVLSNDTLTICIEVAFSTERSVLISNCNKMSLKSKDHDDLSENFGSLLETGAFSDIVLSTKGKDLPAHKLILAARSKVFNAMFQHDMKENRLNRIEMEDMSEETVLEMLRFIYTGKCEKLEELAEELLIVADKYDLNKLKNISGRALFETLSVENAANVLILADTLNAKELKNDVLEFIVSNSSEVLSSKGWNNVLPKSALVDEVCQAFARQLTYERVEKLEVDKLGRISQY